jgi:DNA repair ATPase RecN
MPVSKLKQLQLCKTRLYKLKKTLRDYMRGNSDYSEIASLIQKTLEPLISKVDKLEGKIDLIFSDHVKRSDLESLRKDIQSSFILRAEYEPRHDALIARDSAIESEIKRIDIETQAEFQRLHERLESGKQQIEERFKEETRSRISAAERNWTRIGIVFSVLVALVTFAVFILDHFQVK